MKVFGTDHIIYGSSYLIRMEWLTGGADFVRVLDITEKEKLLILGSNAQSLYGIG